MNKKERRLAMATALQSAAGDMVVVDKVECADKKTKSLIATLDKLGVNPERKTLVILKEANEGVMLAGRNLQKLKLNVASAIKVFDVLNADKIIVEHGALEHIQATYGPAAADA